MFYYVEIIQCFKHSHLNGTIYVKQYVKSCGFGIWYFKVTFGIVYLDISQESLPIHNLIFKILRSLLHSCNLINRYYIFAKKILFAFYRLKKNSSLLRKLNEAFDLAVNPYKNFTPMSTHTFWYRTKSTFKRREIFPTPHQLCGDDFTPVCESQLIASPPHQIKTLPSHKRHPNRVEKSRHIRRSHINMTHYQGIRGLVGLNGALATLN